MMDHPLENLGPERFQHLAQALIVREYPGVTCFPVGQPDGGRDALIRELGQMGERTENSAIAFQVKFARSGKEDIERWVLETAEGELQKVEGLKQRGVRRYVFITNVQGTAHLDVGSIDKVYYLLKNRFDLEVVCWWRDDINRRLDGSWDIKLRYPETLNGQDFFRLLCEKQSNEGQKKASRAIQAFLVEQYREDQEVKFKQVELQNKLLDLFVDLPFRIECRKRPDISKLRLPANLALHIYDSGPNSYTVEERSGDEGTAGTATLLLTEGESDTLDLMVIEGGPGQGKSTLAQYLCQVHRIRILDKASDKSKLPVAHQVAPVYIPFKVDLRDLAEWLVGNDPFATKRIDSERSGEIAVPRSLETFLAHLVRNRSGGLQFEVDDLIEISKITPIFLALDGLDEVADIRSRGEVVSAVSKAVARLKENCRELRVIITSRPAAFANSPGFDPEIFPYLHLGSVRLSQISSYAELWMAARNLASIEKQEFKTILADKMNQPHLRDLARNPMQLTILLSLIHTKGPALPDKRTTLYDQYVDLFFGRESTKNGVVRQHLDLLKDIHRYLAWKLHTLSEGGRRASSGRFSAEQLKSVLTEYLTQERQPLTVLSDIFNAMLERVVMIVSRIEGTYEFEVQPLREYFAARYLYDTAPYSPSGQERSGTKPDRFEAVSRNFYWLNVARFFCGCFSKGELLDLADRVNDLLADQVQRQTRHPVTLAAMLLSDLVFTQSSRALLLVATELSKRNNIYRLISSERAHHESELIRIPVDYGGSVINGVIIKWLREETIRPDVGYRLGRYLTMNVPAKELKQLWVGSRGEFGSAAKWLRFGDHLSLLSHIHCDEIAGLLKTEEFEKDSLQVLWGAGRLDILAGSPEKEAALESWMINKAPPWAPLHKVSAPLYLFPVFFILLYESRSYSRQYSKGFISSQLENFSKVSEVKGPLSSKCFCLSQQFAIKLREDASVTSQAFWDPLIDDFGRAFGDCPALYTLGLVAVSLKRGASGGTRSAFLFDADTSICIRLRTAKNMAKKPGWWIDALSLVEPTHGINLLLYSLALWSFAPIENLPKSTIQEYAKLLESMENSQWVTLTQILFTLNNVYGSRRGLPKSFGDRLFIGSKRYAYLVAICSNESRRQQIFLDHFQNHSIAAAGMNYFRQESALWAAVQRKMDWDAALSIVRGTYRNDAMAIGRLSPNDLPEEVAGQIIDNPHQYPIHLFDQAIFSRTISAQRTIKPIAAVARRDRWFS